MDFFNNKNLDIFSLVDLANSAIKTFSKESLPHVSRQSFFEKIFEQTKDRARELTEKNEKLEKLVQTLEERFAKASQQTYLLLRTTKCFCIEGKFDFKIHEYLVKHFFDAGLISETEANECLSYWGRKSDIKNLKIEDIFIDKK